MLGDPQVGLLTLAQQTNPGTDHVNITQIHEGFFLDRVDCGDGCTRDSDGRSHSRHR
jgi:hypothetical protein